MNAIDQLRRYLVAHAGSADAERLAKLSACVSSEDKLVLSDLYALNWESFQLAIDVLRDWRIDRYYVREARLAIDAPQPASVETSGSLAPELAS